MGLEDRTFRGNGSPLDALSGPNDTLDGEPSCRLRSQKHRLRERSDRSFVFTYTLYSWLDSPWQDNRLHLLVQPVFLGSLLVLDPTVNPSAIPCDGLASPRGGCTGLQLSSPSG